MFSSEKRTEDKNYEVSIKATANDISRPRFHGFVRVFKPVTSLFSYGFRTLPLDDIPIFIREEMVLDRCWGITSIIRDET